MKIIPETSNDIVSIIAAEFRTFGGGRSSASFNPIAEALKNQPPSFAAGVDVAQVVERVLQLANQMEGKLKTNQNDGI